MEMRAVCPIDECDYIAFGDDEKELRKDLRYHLMDIHRCNQVPEDLEILEEEV